jgi:hypothetical protein
MVNPESGERALLALAMRPGTYNRAHARASRKKAASARCGDALAAKDVRFSAREATTFSRARLLGKRGPA